MDVPETCSFCTGTREGFGSLQKKTFMFEQVPYFFQSLFRTEQTLGQIETTYMLEITLKDFQQQIIEKKILEFVKYEAWIPDSSVQEEIKDRIISRITDKPSNYLISVKDFGKDLKIN